MFKKLIIMFIIILFFTSCEKQNYKNELKESEEIKKEEVKVPVITNAKLTFTGDLMVHKWQLDNAYIKKSDTYDFNYCFEPVYKYLENSDLTIGNLETTIAGKDKGYSDFPRFNSPEEFIDALKNSGFDLLTTANNHSNDKGEGGILNTLNVLDNKGIEHFGTYSSAEERDTIFIKEINNIKFAFLSYTYGTNGLKLPEGKDYLVNIMSDEIIKNDINKAKEFNPDFIVVMPHMGNEYEDKPKQVFIDWIDRMIEYGADIVVASHPHVLQPMEYRSIICEDGSERNAFVAYSMGNFISSQRTEPRDAGVILNFYFEKIDEEKAILKDVSYIPTWVQWKDKKQNYNIRVLPIYDFLNQYENEIDTGLRSQDIQRLKKVHSESNKAVTGEDIQINEIKEEYFIKK